MLNKIKRYFCLAPSNKVNINDILKPIYYILTLLGLFPYNIRYNEAKKCFKTIKHSIYLRSMCATAFVVVIYALMLESFQKLIDIKSEDQCRVVVISKTNYLIELVAYVLYCTVAYVSVFLSRHRYMRILNAIAAAWAETAEDNRSELVKQLRFHAYALAMGAIVFVLLVNMGLFATNVMSTWQAILIPLTFRLPQFIQFASMGFYFTLVMIVATLLSDINMQMEKLSKRKKIYTNRRNDIGDGIFVKVEPKPDLSLMRLELAYIRAFEIKSDIIKVFEAPLLISTVQSFHAILICIYMTCHGVVGQSLIYSPYFCVILLLFQSIKIFSLAFAGYKLKSEALKIGQTLHRIPTELCDTNMYSKIQHFCTLMKCYGFEFSIYGFFSLDMALIYTMVASVTMYLLILIQLEH